ncbi:MAG: L-rhamnose/proton symporter RhaT [Candidatus Acidiferrales bacterium]
MGVPILTGVGVILLAGILQGIFALPMKYARGWNHENIWLVFAFTGLVVFPWLVVLATIPHAIRVYHITSPQAILEIVGFGVLWGVGATLTGVGLKQLGIGLGLSIILGLSASVGSLVPLIVLAPKKLATPQGHLFLFGTVVMLIGVAFCARAGARRDAQQRSLAEPRGIPPSSFIAGLVVCTCSGLLSATLNFSYAFGGEAIDHARALGASPVWAANIVAAPAVTGGFIANLVFCVYMLRKNSSTPLFVRAGSGVNWLYGTVMGAFWFGGLALYGLGLSWLGSMGAVAGWPVLMGTIILASNAGGYLSGEWKQAGRRSGILLGVGMAIVLGALWILGMAQQS